MAALRLRLKHPMKGTDTGSFHSLVTLHTTQVYQKTPTQIYASKIPAQKLHRPSHFGWMLSKGDSVIGHKFSDRVEHLLSISPSEYVRREKERKNREQGLRSCIQSLSSLLNRALNNNGLDVHTISKEDIQKSLNALRDTFETQLNEDSYLNDMPTASLQSLLEQNCARRALRNSLSPDNLVSAIYHSSNVSFSRSSHDTRVKSKSKKSKNVVESKENLSVRSSESLSELFRKQSMEFMKREQRNSRGVNANLIDSGT